MKMPLFLLNLQVTHNLEQPALIPIVGTCVLGQGSVYWSLGSGIVNMQVKQISRTLFLREENPNREKPLPLGVRPRGFQWCTCIINSVTQSNSVIQPGLTKLYYGTANKTQYRRSWLKITLRPWSFDLAPSSIFNLQFMEVRKRDELLGEFVYI